MPPPSSNPCVDGRSISTRKSGHLPRGTETGRALRRHANQTRPTRRPPEEGGPPYNARQQPPPPNHPLSLPYPYRAVTALPFRAVHTSTPYTTPPSRGILTGGREAKRWWALGAQRRLDEGDTHSSLGQQQNKTTKGAGETNYSPNPPPADLSLTRDRNHLDDSRSRVVEHPPVQV